jgi:hypothetical protein
VLAVYKPWQDPAEGQEAIESVIMDVAETDLYGCYSEEHSHIFDGETVFTYGDLTYMERMLIHNCDTDERYLLVVSE